MNIGDAFPSKYLKARDLAGQEWQLTMTRVEMESMGDGDAKPVLYFAGAEKGLVLNRVNSEMIALMYSEETEHWQGQPITIKPDKTQFGGKIVDCIRVVWKQHPKPAIPTPAKAFQAHQAKAAQAPVDPLGDDPLDGDKVPF